MYAYIDRKKKLPVTTLLRAIGFNSDKDIIDIFGLADEIEVTPQNLEDNKGRKLAAKVLKTWTEDFEDEDTGEVIPIERTPFRRTRQTPKPRLLPTSTNSSAILNHLTRRPQGTSSINCSSQRRDMILATSEGSA